MHSGIISNVSVMQYIGVIGIVKSFQRSSQYWDRIDKMVTIEVTPPDMFDIS